MGTESGSNPAMTRPEHEVTQLCGAYCENAHRLVHDLGDHLQLSLAYVDRATVERHLERALTPPEWQSIRRQFRAMDFDGHVVDQGTVRTRWIDAICERAEVAGSDATGAGS